MILFHNLSISNRKKTNFTLTNFTIKIEFHLKNIHIKISFKKFYLKNIEI